MRASDRLLDRCGVVALVMSLLLRKRTVSAKAALKLLERISHAALHFNRESCRPR